MWTALWIKQKEKHFEGILAAALENLRSRQPDPARSIVRTVPSERFVQIRILISVGGAASNHMEKSVDKLYGGLTKIRTRRRAAGSTNGTEPVRPVLGALGNRSL